MKVERLAFVACTVTLVSFVVAPRVAAAQEAVIAEVISDDSTTADGVALIEGRGLELSPGVVFHPALSVEGGFNDNVFYQEEDEDPTSAGMMRVVGRLHISNFKDRADDLGDVEDPDTGAELTPRSVEFRGGVRAAYQEYLNGGEEVRSQRNLNLDAIADMTLLPAGPVSFIVRDKFLRQQRSPNFEDESTLERDDNRAWVGIRLQPVGKTIGTTLHYENWIHFFEDRPAQFANRMNHTIGWLTEFQWRPFTKLSADVSYGFYGPMGGDSELGGMPFKTKSNPFRIVGGMSTLLTEATTLKLYGGYARAGYDVGQGYSAPVAGGELGIRWSETGRFVALYGYDNYDSFNANFFRDHTLAAKFIQRINFAVLDGGPEIRFRKFGGIPTVLGDPERKDLVVSGTARLQFVIAEKFNISAQYRLSMVDTDYLAKIIDDMGMSFGTDNPSYIRNEVSLGVGVAY